MPLPPGTRLGPYEVLAPLGAGGMGEVYRARDTRLGRDVALKVLPQHLSPSPDSRSRFEREARTISSLNHPHICVLHDVGREGDTDYLVMELVEGETLAQRLARGPLPAPDVLRLGAQIADALDRAHRAGVVHRDLKPGNVMLTRSGAKLMDFGLARATGPAGGSGPTAAAATQSPTQTQPLTAEGTIVGTFQYMAPEQLEGREADARSDLWGLGCVLYEMATGKRAFEGSTQASLISAIMRDQPPSPTEMVPLFPAGLGRLVMQCLAKDPDDRWQSAGDVRRELEWIANDSATMRAVTAPAGRRARWGSGIAWTLAGLAAGVLAGWLIAGSRAAARAPVRSDLLPPDQEGSIVSFALSPAGSAIAFTFADSAGTTRLWVRALDEPEARVLDETKNATFPFWSSDSRQIGFFADGKLRRIAASGGPVLTLADAPVGRGGTWSGRGIIVFAPDARGPLLQIPESGGTPQPATTLDSTRSETSHRFPCFLANGRHFLYMTDSGDSGLAMLGSLDDRRGRFIAETGRAAVVDDGDRMLTVRDGVIFTQTIDARRGKPRGQPVALPDRIARTNTVRGAPSFTVSRSGALAYAPADLRPSDFVWFDNDRPVAASPITGERYQDPLVSRDGRRVLVNNNASNYVVDLATGARVRVSPEAGQTSWVIWGPNDELIANYAASSGPETVRLGANGEGVVGHWLGRHSNFVVPTGPTSDGRYLVVNEQVPGAEFDIGYVVAGDTSRIEPYLRRRANDVSGTPSPDGRWLAYASNVDGTPQLYLDSFPSPRHARRVSNAPVRLGPEPMAWWREDGRVLYYLAAASRTVMACDIGPGPTPTIGSPRVAIQLPAEHRGCAMSPDGRRCLVIVPRGARVSTLRLVENWTDTRDR